MIEGLLRRLLYLVSRGRITRVDDAGNAQLLQVRVAADWLQDKLPRMAEYGFQSNPPAGSDAVLLFLAGNTSDGVVIATGSQQYRLKGLASGEVAISDNSGQKVYLSAAGIRIEGGSLPIQINSSSTVTIAASGGCNVSSDLTVTGIVRATNFATSGLPSYTAHTHNMLSGGIAGHTSPPDAGT